MNVQEQLALALDPSLTLKAQGMDPDPWQHDFLLCQSRFILLNCCRGAGKTRTTSALALHTALFQPKSLTLLISKAQRQAKELLRYVKQGYRAIGRPVDTIKENETELEYPNGSRIIALPGSEGTIRSFQGVNLLVIDEAARVPDDLYASVSPMTQTSKGRTILLSTPYGQRGFFWREWLDAAAPWTRFKVPWDQCPRIAAEDVAEERRKFGDAWVAQEYSCDFTAMEGLVYPNFQELTACVSTTFALGSRDRKVGGIDFGWRNPFAAVWGILDSNDILWSGFRGHSGLFSATPECDPEWPRCYVATSQTKSGKTTLASLLFVRLQAGGQLAGLAVAPGRSLIVSEESTRDWAARCRLLGIDRNIRFVCRPFKGARPSTAQWFSLIAQLDNVQRREGLDLLIIDPLATLLPGHAENSPQHLLDCLLPLQELANRGLAVCLVHHTGKGKRLDGQAARGTSALGGFVDIMIEMSHFKRARSRDRRRRLCAYSRYEQTPRHLVIELNGDGTDYLVRTDAAGAVLVSTWPQVHDILAGATEKLRQETVLERWPEDGNPPNRSTLLRWLTRATRQGLICRAGSGRRGDAFCYWLAEREPLLWPGRLS